MRTFSKLLSAPFIAGAMGAAALTLSMPAAARDHHRYGGERSAHHEYHHWRGHRDRDGGPSVTFGFYGGYPYYGPYDGYYGTSYSCNPNSWYYDPDECYGGYYGYYGDWDD